MLKIQANKAPADSQTISELGRNLNICMSQFSWEDLLSLESLVKENFEDAALLNSLAKLQHAQILINEKLHNTLGQNTNLNQQ